MKALFLIPLIALFTGCATQDTEAERALRAVIADRIARELKADDKEVIPPDGPDTTQKFDKDGHPNFGQAR